MRSLYTLLLLFLALAPARAQLKASLDSLFTVVGEEARLTLLLDRSEQPLTAPAAPRLPGLSITADRPGLLRDNNSRNIQIFPFKVRCFEAGRHTIPSFTVNVGGQILRSQPVVLTVFPAGELEWHTARIQGGQIEYATALFTPDSSPYVGETIPVEAKIYLPSQQATVRSGLAQLKQDGLTAWRFEASRTTNRVTLRSKPFNAVTFRSTASPLRSGPVTLGPGSARVGLQVLQSGRGLQFWQSSSADLNLPARRLEARPLPPGAPEGFDGAVGQFRLSMIANTSNLEEGDPVSLRLTVSGTGNLDTLKAPRLAAPDGEWKNYEPSRLERRGERRDVTGSVSFSQIIRPLLAQREVPPFELSYFDPVTEQYRSTRTAPIPFTLVPSETSKNSAIIPDLGTPVENMQGILGLVDPLRHGGGPSGRPGRLWQVLPAILAALLAGRIFRQRVLPRFRRPLRERQIAEALAAVEQAAPGTNDFLRAAGHFVEAWIPPDQREGEVRELLERRDGECFRPSPSPSPVEKEERRRILEQLRKRALAATPLLVALAVTLLSPAAPADPLYQQAEAAWAEGHYRSAIEHYRMAHPDPPIPADVEYNLGCCHFQLGQPGLAALHYRRALLLNPRHSEARQNLRFLEGKLGTITVRRAPHEEQLAVVPRAAYLTTLAASIWVTGLAALTLAAFSTGGIRTAAWSCLVAAPTLALASWTALHFYPDDTGVAPPEELVVVTSPERIAARTEASHNGQLVIEVPPGSPGRLLAPRFGWSYVELANGTRGWIPSDALDTLVPSETPQPPAAGSET